MGAVGGAISAQQSGRAVSASFAEISINSSGWTNLLSSFSNVLVASIQNKTGVQIKLNSDNGVGYVGFIVEDDEQRNYNDLDAGFSMFARSETGNVTLNVEVLHNG